MKKFLLSVSLMSCIAGGLQAQIAITGDPVQGTPLFAKHTENVKGSPYFFDDWKKGNVRLKNKEVYSGMDLKFNQLDNELIFLSQNKTPNRFAQPVAEFIIYQDDRIFLTFRNGFPLVEKNNGDTYYQVLEDGKVKVLKHAKKSIIEAIPYGQSVAEKSILKADIYYLLVGDQMHRIKADKKQLLSILKSEPLANYIASNKMKVNSEDELITAVNFYNNLP
jgi:hypothetical protein